ncbi:hypothetical protein CBW18_09215 [Pedobacter sp. AJM]|nr:hypothetical protein CBW18_09215 [Pedobacter sp. AJM]
MILLNGIQDLKRVDLNTSTGAGFQKKATGLSLINLMVTKILFVNDNVLFLEISQQKDCSVQQN